MAITRILLLGTLLTLIGTAFPALAATKQHHRVTHVHSAIYNMVVPTAAVAAVRRLAAQLAVALAPALALVRHQIGGDDPFGERSCRS
jgi:hypothetical protein